MKKIITLLLVFGVLLSRAYAGGDTSLKGRKNYLIEYSYKGEMYVGAIDIFISKIRSDEKKLRKLQRNITKLKVQNPLDLDKPKSVEIYAILNYLEKKIEISLGTGIEKGQLISVHYTGKFIDGTVFDSSYDRGQELRFTAGVGQMIPGFDAGVLGMKEGETKTLTLSPEDAYGVYDSEKTETLSKDTLQTFIDAGYKLEAGEYISTQFGEFLILESTDDTITIDLNHSLAGKTLIFEVEIISVEAKNERD